LLQHQQSILFQPVVGGQLRKSITFTNWIELSHVFTSIFIIPWWAGAKYRRRLDESRRADSTDGPTHPMPISNQPVVPSHSAFFPEQLFTHPQSRLPKEPENDPYKDTCFWV
jgi:hypothetical protein